MVIEGMNQSADKSSMQTGGGLGTAINQLPPELLDFILAHLDEAKKYETRKVSKLWNSRTIKTASSQENVTVTQSIQLIISKIDKEKYPEVIVGLT